MSVVQYADRLYLGQHPREKTLKGNMAIQIVNRVICDRCSRVVEEMGVGEGNPDNQSPAVYLEGDGEETVKFFDLCKKCIVRVKHLVGQIRLDKDASKEEPAVETEPEEPTVTVENEHSDDRIDPADSRIDPA